MFRFLFALLFISFVLLLGVACKSSRNTPQKDQLTPNAPVTPPVTDISDEMPSKVPAYPDTIWYKLPDDYVLRIFLRGDEHSHIALTVDGYQLVMNPEGFYEYVIKDDQGLPQATGVIARNPEDRTEEDWRILRGVTNILNN